MILFVSSVALHGLCMLFNEKYLILSLKEMAADREVLREVWDGHIPVCFRLASEEIYTLQHPEPFYVSFQMISMHIILFLAITKD